jgi:putative heme-binding domain-containing protein
MWSATQSNPTSNNSPIHAMKLANAFAHLGLLCLLITSPLALAQHATGADLFSGEQAFQNFCASCHGAAGNLIAGVDLGHGNFRQPYSDAQLQAIVINGIAGTPMPATTGMSQAQAVQIVAYLRSRGTQSDAGAGGDAARGAVLFTGKGECMSCHRLAGQGARLGPALDSIGQLRSSAELAASLLEPNSQVQANQRFYTVLTRDGQSISGRLLNQDTFSVQLFDSNEQLRSWQKAELQSWDFAPSPMPSLRGKFSEQEVADLVQYLVSLRGAAKP